MRFLHTLATIGLALFLSVTLPVFASPVPDALLHEPVYLISGKQVSLADFQGKKPVYLKFWATWCQPCIEQMPHFEHVQQEYGNEIEVIAINLGINDDLGTVKQAIGKYGLTMPMAIDESGDLAQSFRLMGTPYHLVFDKDMNLIHMGHKADSVLDSSLALVAQRKQAEILDPGVLVEGAADIPLHLDDGKLHALLFTATWCDWYWAETRPAASKSCVDAQNMVNALAHEHKDIAWQGVINRLWTEDKDLADYKAKFSVTHPVSIDKSNRLFHQYNINELPALLLIKNGKIIGKVVDFSDKAAAEKKLYH